MFELSLHILDLVQNSVAAGAKRVGVLVRVDHEKNLLVIEIIDDGKGMDVSLLAKVTSPFTTTRTTRKVGLGIPMMKQLAESCGGALSLRSTPGAGTELRATMELGHVDRPPLGDLAGTMHALVLGNPESPDFALTYSIDDRDFEFDTEKIRQAMGGLPLNEPELIAWIGDYLKEGIAEVENQ
jgi:hypothetical protein